jgi:hypothetical protein
MQKQTQCMLEVIYSHADNIRLLAIQCLMEKQEKKREKMVKKIMKYTEAIEQQYSSNWH